MDNAHYGRQCEGKFGHLTRDSAEREAKRMHKETKGTYHVYPCTYCQRFHIGRVRSVAAAIRRTS